MPPNKIPDDYMDKTSGRYQIGCANRFKENLVAFLAGVRFICEEN
jgi:hypothetical protein